jgi:hypothetical protein
MTYKQVIKHTTGQIYAVQRSDGWIIPFDPVNSDYQYYQAWVAQGNTPLPPA